MVAVWGAGCQASLDSFLCITAVTSKFVTILNKSPKYWPNLKSRRYLYGVLISGVSPSITKVLNCLFLGGRRDAEALASANPHQIATVVTLCEERVARRNSAIRYLHFPVRDARPIRISWLNAILIAIE